MTARAEVLGDDGEEGDIADAYLAVTAVSLARSLAVVPPWWARHPDRKLRRSWFASAGPAIRATLLLESPAPFRERNLFVSEKRSDARLTRDRHVLRFGLCTPQTRRAA